MAQAFMRQGRKTPMGPRVTIREKLGSRSSVPTCRDRQRMGCTGRAIRPLGRGYRRQVGPVSPARKALTIGGLTDGDGAAGLPSLD
jgi:hypothetical protein